MSNNTKSQRISFTVAQNVYSDFDKVTYMQRRNLKDVLINFMQSYIEQNKNEIARYNKTFGNKPATDEPTNTPTNSKQTKAPVCSPEQRREAVEALLQVITENNDRMIDEGEQETSETLGIRLKRGGIAVDKTQLNGLIDESFIKILSKQIKLKGNRPTMAFITKEECNTAQVNKLSLVDTDPHNEEE